MTRGKKILAGRHTARMDAPFVVFMIGLRINRLVAVRHWWPTLMEMPRMLKALESDPESGLLARRTVWYWRGVEVIQYWRSFEHLERFARDTKGPHWPAWKRFYQTIRDDGPVGIWHETYKVEPGGFETLYGNMPTFGLGAAGQSIPLADLRRARRRLADGGGPADSPPPPP